MGILKKNPIFTTILVLFILLFIGALVMSWLTFASSADAKAQYAKVTKKAQQVAQLSPKPTSANLKTIKQNLEASKASYYAKLDDLSGKGSETLLDGMPSSSTDLFFEIQSYIDQMTALAEENDVQVADDMKFGFKKFITEERGPDPEYIQLAYEQLKMLSYMMSKLISSVPVESKATLSESTTSQLEIVSVARSAVEPASRQASSKLEVFEINPHMSAKVENAVDTASFQITFRGITESLRLFLNEMAKFEWPLVVKGVEVQLDEDTKKPSRQTSSAGGGGFLWGDSGASDTTAEEPQEEPVVDENISTFVVTIELIKIVFPDIEEEAAK